jgi:hypothetical protein
MCFVWLLIRGCINHLRGVTPTDLRMGVPAPYNKLRCLPVTLTETQRMDAINSKFQSDREPRELKDWLEAQPLRFALLGISVDSYNAMICITSQFS